MAEPVSAARSERERFRSLRQLRDEHNRLLRAYQGDPAAALAEVEAFLQRGRASGELLDPAQERSSAQSMLDYWATTLLRQTGVLPEAELADFDPAVEQALADSECPYPGVEAFAEAQSGLFFGRESWIQAVHGHLERSRVVALVGEQGAGKTSLLAAGLLPLLRGQGLTCLPVVLPGTRPVASLVASLTADGSPAGDAIATVTGRSDGVLELLGRLPAPVVLTIDGLEELFGPVGQRPEDRTAFIRSLMSVVEAGGEHRVVLSAAVGGITGSAEAQTLRDCLAKHAPQDERRGHLGPLGAADLARVIKAPAELVGLRLEEGLVGALTRDYLGEPLAFLQLALVRLWEARAGNSLTRDAYLQLAPGRQLLQKTAEEAFAGLDERQSDLARRVFLFLMPAGPVAGTVKARPAALHKLTAAAGDGSDKVLEVLQRHRLVRRSDRAVGEAVVEVIDPALAPSWPRLREWVHERELRDAGARADRESRLRRKATGFAVLFAAAAVLAAFGLWQATKQGKRNYLLSRVNEGLTASFVDHRPDEGLAVAASALEIGGHDVKVEAALLAAAYNSATARRLGPAADASASPGVTAFALTGMGGRALAGSQDGSLQLWDLDRGVLVKRVEPDESGRLGHGDEVRALAVSPNGAIALSGSEDGTLILWDLGQLRPRALLRAKGTPAFRAVGISPDGRIGLSFDRDREMTRWDLTRAEMLGEPITGTHGRQVNALAFAPSGDHFLTGSEDGRIRIWETSSLRLVETLERDPDHEDEVLSVAVSPNSCRALAGYRDTSVVLWDIAAAVGGTDCADFSADTGFRSFAAHDDAVRTVAFSVDGAWALSGSDDRRVVLWRFENDQLEMRRSFIGHSSRVTGLEFGAHALNRAVGRHFVSSSQDGSIRVWDLEGGTELRRHADLGVRDVNAVAVLADSAGAVLASSQGTALSLDLGTGKPTVVARFPSTDAPLAISPDATRLIYAEAVAVDPSLNVVDLATGKELRLRGHRDPASAVAFSAEGGHVASGDLGGAVLVWDLSGGGETRKPTSTIPTARLFAEKAVEARQVKGVALRAAADLVVSGHERGQAFLWNSKTGRLIKQLVGHNDRVRAVAFRPGQPQFATGSRDQRVILWDQQGNKVREFLGHQNEVRAITFTADGRLMVSAGEDRQVLVWDVEGGRLIARLVGHRERVMAVAVDAKGERVLSGDDGGTLIEWGLIPIGADILASVRSARYVPVDDVAAGRRWSWWRLRQ